jgi:pimeloyl-ACP methyl ester carboxylesterase
MIETSTIREQQVTLSHGPTRYLEAGTGYPTILLHASQYHSGGHEFRFNIGPLSSSFRVLAPDFVGWGPGGRLQQPYSFAYLVDFVREFQDALGLEKTNIVGQSMGGWVAGLFAYESPERVNKLVLACSGGLNLDAHGMGDRTPPSREKIRKYMEAGVHAEGADVEALTNEADGLVNTPGLPEALNRVYAHMGDPETRERYQLARRLDKIKVPTLVVIGANDGSVPRWREQHTRIPNSQFLVIEGAGHRLSTEKPEAFNQAVGDFLRS